MESQEKKPGIAEAIKSLYRARTPKSMQLNSMAEQSLPGGDTRQSVYFDPYPTYMISGDGCYIADADGNKYVDFMNNYTSLIHGHNTSKINEAVARQLAHGTVFGAPHESQFELGELLCSRVPSIDKVRFCNSGTEATMFAIRAARAFTGKDTIIKMEGGYHGTHDLAEASVSPSIEDAGSIDKPKTVPYSKGIPAGSFANVVVVPFNNIGATKAAIHANRREIAAIIIEPVMNAAGTIPATKEYLKFLREITNEEGILLLFDEVATFRLSFAGAQGYYQITPDLSAIGKIIGGGFPIGAFGGREDIMSLFSPKKGVLHHAGTFNGHPISMVAGLAAMRETTTETFVRINALGDMMRLEINKVFSESGIRGHASGLGSLITIHYTSQEIRNYRDARVARNEAKDLPDYMHLSLMNRGIFLAARGQLSLSTPMGEKEINVALQALKEACMELKPFIKENLPHLLLK
jgi:glutamate-1-semialdehyde 2,1-aminomutase